MTLLLSAIAFQALAVLTRGDDVSGLTMNLHGREYTLINEAACKYSVHTRDDAEAAFAAGARYPCAIIVDACKLV